MKVSSEGYTFGIDAYVRARNFNAIAIPHRGRPSFGRDAQPAPDHHNSRPSGSTQRGKVVPVTARSREVLGRVNIEQNPAVCSNGGCIIAADGEVDAAWHARLFEHYASLELLREEVEQDIEHGLLTKTAIHPSQVDVIHQCYQPSACDLHEAQTILEADAYAVFGSNGSMCEPATHRRWAGNVIARAETFGIDERDVVSAIRVA